MSHYGPRTLQEMRTSLSPAEALASAKHFFADRPNVYAAYVEQEGPTHLSLRGQGGEEIVIGVRPIEGGTAVTGSTYLFDQQVQRFFSSLPPAPEAAPVPDPAMEQPSVATGSGAA
jgi:hypothetical protein